MEKFDLSLESLRTSHVVAGILLSWTTYTVYNHLHWKRYYNLPRVGPPGPVGYVKTLLRSVKEHTELMEEGRERFGEKPFLIPTLQRTEIIVSPKYLEEFLDGDEKGLNQNEGTNMLLQTDYTMGWNIRHTEYHPKVIRTQYTRNLDVLSPIIYDEVSEGFQELVDPKLSFDTWTPLRPYTIFLDIIARSVNRTFVGLPLARNPELIQVAIKHTFVIVISGGFLKFFPEILKTPINAFIKLFWGGSARIASKILTPFIAERLQVQKLRQSRSKAGQTDEDEPVDLLQWYIQATETIPAEHTPKALVQRILVSEFAAIHTTSMSFIQAFYELIAHPEWVQPLRDEIEQAIQDEDAQAGGKLIWSKALVARFKKMDAFLKETFRLNPLGDIGMSRGTSKPYTFADGTTVPPGYLVSVPIPSINLNPSVYPEPHKFDPNRFLSKTTASDGAGVRFALVSTSPDYIHWGHGKHACSGRFFAANELKTLLGYVVMNYDVKTQDGGRPKNDKAFGTNIAKTDVDIYFKRRRRD